MNISRSMNLFSILFFALITIATSELSASGSDEKTPEVFAADKTRKATAKYNSGVEHMNKAKRYDEQGDSLFAFNYRATTQDKAKREFEKAAENFGDAAKIDESMKEAFNNLGFCLRKLGKLAASLDAYNKALALDSTFAQAREYRGELFLAMDKPELAQKELDFLNSVKSPYADSLAMSLNLYHIKYADENLIKSHD